MSDRLELAPEWQAWLCTNLLGGERVQDLIDALADEGVSESVARDAIHAIQHSPLFSAARDFALRTRRAEQILRGIRSRSRLLKIERRDDVDGEGFHQHIRAAGRPIVLSDFTKDWPARRWTFADLKARFGDAEVQVMEGRDGDPDYDRNHAQHTTQTTLGAFVDRACEGPSNDFYLVARDGAFHTPSLAPLRKDLSPPPGFLNDRPWGGMALWLGPQGTITPLHHDQSDILFCQFVGRKRFYLVAPEELAVAEAARGLYGPDLASFADDDVLRDVRVHEVEVRPGDTLFIPFGWWHHVEALDPSISVAINSFDDSHNAWYQPGGF